MSQDHLKDPIRRIWHTEVTINADGSSPMMALPLQTLRILLLSFIVAHNSGTTI